MNDAQSALAWVREALPKGSESVEWEWWTSNSFRRLSVRGSTVDGGVMYAYVAHDGQPDISIRQSDMALIAACSPANMTAILAHVEAQAAEIERLTAERDELRRQLAEAEQDARRYRDWLRGGANIPPESTRWARWEVRHWDGRHWNTLFAEQMDAAIDAAMGGGDAG